VPAIAVLALVAGVAAAQDAPEGPRGRPREEIFRLIDDYVARSLQEKVGLTDEQLERALPLVRRLNADRRRFAERRMRASFQMRRAVRAGSITDARAAEMVQEAKAAEVEEAAAVRAGQEAVDGVLTPVQQVKYRILETEIEHRLRELTARVRAQRRDGARRRGNAPRQGSPEPR
jgi:hypothetical protein